MQDMRLAAGQAWLESIIERTDWQLEVASADASFRRYFRVQYADGSSQILMDAPPDKENIEPFIDVAQRLTANALHAPEILAQNKTEGYLLLSDLGTRTYLPELTADSAGSLYNDAMQALRKMQHVSVEQLPAYDEALLRKEMALFRDWYLDQHKQITLSPTQASVWSAINDCLVENALAQPQVFVHRDYHSRNLMITHDNNPGIIDFQDAVRGPVTYDLVSLLRDCYIAWPQSQVECWVEGYRQQANIQAEAKQFLRWFDLMGVQRHLKAIGIFARLNHRDGKPGYLNDIPRTLNYVQEVSSRYKELAGLSHLLEQHINA